MIVVITGPESTGKTNLAGFLANQFNGIYVPEYARTYIENLGRPYTSEDVEHIARFQVDQFREVLNMNNQVVFLDTYLIITKIWFEEVFNSCPTWLGNALINSKIDLFLLCNTDIPWKPDNVRENGGMAREILFDRYKAELDMYKVNYRVISGKGTNRERVAMKAVEDQIINNQHGKRRKV